jgi:glycosyltransferase involved in cell wall biosynthesis
MDKIINPLISVIINGYNSEKYLEIAIKSILAQSYENWEIIFWDNQSTDNSAKIVNDFGNDKIRYYHAQYHTTLGEARNLAVQVAKGDWLGFLDCDDIWLPDKLSLQVGLIQEKDDESLGLIYGRTALIGNSLNDNNYSNELLSSYKNKDLPEGAIFEQLLFQNFIPLVSAIVKKSIFWKIGGIPARYRRGEDYYLFLKIAELYTCHAVQETCCCYRIHGANLTNSQKEMTWEEHVEIIKIMAPPNLQKKALLNVYADYAIYLIKEKNIAKGVKLIFDQSCLVLLFLKLILKLRT